MLANSAPFDGLTSKAAFDAIAAWLEKHDRGERKVNFRLRDWGVSRQRYWGCPIPVIHKADGSVVPAEASSRCACPRTSGSTVPARR